MCISFSKKKVREKILVATFFVQSDTKKDLAEIIVHIIVCENINV